MRIEANRTVCAASGQCVLAAPRVFAQDEVEGAVVVLDVHPSEDERAAVMRAVQECPTKRCRSLKIEPFWTRPPSVPCSHLFPDEFTILAVSFPGRTPRRPPWRAAHRHRRGDDPPDEDDAVPDLPAP